ncbi:copper chaperone PCu(A)C [Bosea beijingensis]|uniref:copper chaperone PCu(A)C n=1 Tax=Bosea beijingensis TaxID=3068632 RepID=UPI002741AB0C|nr:copper chaperone PCu(A)C [Bosea sp. REN20]
MNRSVMGAVAAALSIAHFPTVAVAQDYTVGSLKIDHPWARATPPAAKVGGGYLKIVNSGTTPDRLLGGSTEASARLEIHESSLVDGIARMREKTDGVAVGAGETVELKPNAIHLMLVDLKAPLKQGEKIQATLRFEKAGPVDVEFQIQGIGAQPQASTDHATH